MEEGGDVPPFWKQTSTTLRRCHRSPSLLLSHLFLIIVLIFFVNPSHRLFTGQNFGTNLVKKNWSALKLVNSLILILWTIHHRRNDDSSSNPDEDKGVPMSPKWCTKSHINCHPVNRLNIPMRVSRTEIGGKSFHGFLWMTDGDSSTISKRILIVRHRNMLAVDGDGNLTLKIWNLRSWQWIILCFVPQNLHHRRIWQALTSIHWFQYQYLHPGC